MILNPSALTPWSFITSIFLHGSIAHIFFNGFALFMFGPYLERQIGTRDFILFFLAAGIIGNACYVLAILAGIIPSAPALGASGAIYGILGALSILLPSLVVYIYFVPMPIRYATILWLALETIGTFNPNSGIASVAHLGGLLFGIAYGFYYKNKIKRDVVGPNVLI